MCETVRCVRTIVASHAFAHRRGAKKNSISALNLDGSTYFNFVSFFLRRNVVCFSNQIDSQRFVIHNSFMHIVETWVDVCCQVDVFQRSDKKVKGRKMCHTFVDVSYAITNIAFRINCHQLTTMDFKEIVSIEVR